MKVNITRWFFLCIGALAPVYAFAQQQAPSPNPPERDTAFTQRKVVVPDSLPLPWIGMGRLPGSDEEVDVQITKSGLRKLQYGQLAEALYRGTHWTPLSHGGFGQNDGLSVMGGLNVDLGVSINGRPLSEPWSGTYQLVQAQPAGMERIEILTGTDAVGLAPSMTLSAMNMQSMIHNSATPYTALWYHQGGGDIVAMDASFSQNVAENLNVTLGVRRSGANGRYVNTQFDIWNIRAGIRWTLSARSHLSVSYELASLNTGLWGGLRTVGLSSEFTEDAAP
ncbi:MAG: TonB-dependent receptor, partial [Candidatus Kapabacteria bacterium]|nr:TonB-dependent receptor [Candidatus Kapabacteria bacterium]